MQEVKVLAPAKVNLLLRVLGKREDGFHELETIFHEISLADEITFVVADEISMRCSEPRIPTDERNLVIRAARMMHELFGAPKVHATLWKRIPFGGGMGGGSSDAAATLRALGGWCERKPSETELARAALELGSDVPFFLVGGAAYARGRGEELQAIGGTEEIPLLLLFPNRRVSTPMAFRTLSDQRRGKPVDEPWGLERSRALLERSRWPELRNDLEAAVGELLPELADCKRSLEKAGARHALMSGSGSTVFGMFDSAAARDHARFDLAGSYRCVAADTRVRSQLLPVERSL